MVFDPIKRLEEGNVDFVFDLTIYERENLIKIVRKSNNKVEIINGFLDKLLDLDPYFCFEIIYDVDEYKDNVFYLLDRNNGSIFWTTEKLTNILTRTKWGKEYIFQSLDIILEKYEDIIPFLLKYIFENFSECQNFIKKLYLHKDLHIRFLFMKYLVDNHIDKLSNVYDDIMKYLTSYTHQEFEQLTFLPKLMDFHDISKLAISFLKQKDRKTYLKLKENILKNYPENDLAYLLIDSPYKELEWEFFNDSDRLFVTSHDYQFYIYENYTSRLSKELVDNFTMFLSYFRNSKNHVDEFRGIEYIFSNGLGFKLQEYVNKYLSLSKRYDSEYVTAGSTSICYRIGDYAFKLSMMKWSYEEQICPNLYIIIKNLEEIFVRSEKGCVVAGLEIQKFLTKSLKDYPVDIRYQIIDFLKNELERLGWRNADSLIDGPCGDNCMLLDTYLDADASNLKLLPDFFKKYPAVYIDRDLFYRLDNHNCKERPMRFH